MPCVDKTDAGPGAKQNRRTAAAPNRNPAKRLRFGSEEQQNERDELCNEMKKLVASDMSLATSWCGHEDSNPNAGKHENLKVLSPQ